MGKVRSWVAVLALVLSAGGCCGWCEKHCNACRQPPAVATYAAPNCCCVPAVQCCPPGTAPVAAPTWQRSGAVPPPPAAPGNGCCNP